METGNFSGLRNGNWKFYGFHSVKRKFFRITSRKPENLWFPFIPELSRNSGLRNKFPDHFISKMENFFRKNGNPRFHDSRKRYQQYDNMTEKATIYIREENPKKRVLCPKKIYHPPKKLFLEFFSSMC